MQNGWIDRLHELNRHLGDAFSPERLGSEVQRRQVLLEHIGSIRRLSLVEGQTLQAVLGRKPMVGVDGSVSSFGGEYPHYIDFLRALAMSTDGRQALRHELYCPLVELRHNWEVASAESDHERRQRNLAELEMHVAVEAAEQVRPALLLLDGPLVRFDMRANRSFNILRQKVLQYNVLLCGCIENIESRVISSLLPEPLSVTWRGAFDRDILWDVLQPGEVLEIRRPAKGRGDSDAGPQSGPTLRTWFMRASWNPGVVGLDMLEDQVEAVRPLVDYLYTLTPQDGRGIPVWLDLVDREVRLTRPEVEAYLDLLEPNLRDRFSSKRQGRVL